MSNSATIIRNAELTGHMVMAGTAEYRKWLELEQHLQSPGQLVALIWSAVEAERRKESSASVPSDQ